MQKQNLLPKIAKTVATLSVATFLFLFSLNSNAYALGDDYFKLKGVWKDSFGKPFDSSGNGDYFLQGDFNGDGKGDVMAVSSNMYAHGAPVNLKFLKGTGVSFVDGGPWNQNFSLGNGEVLIADINGDYRDDLVYSLNDSNYVRSFYWAQSLGNTFATPKLLISNFGKSNDDIAVLDFNGDDKDDLVLATYREDTVNSTLNWYVLESNGSAYVNKGRVLTNFGKAFDEIYTGDFTGDGKSDVMLSETRSKPNNARSWHLLESTGNGGFISRGTVLGAYGEDVDQVLIGDFNTDGKADISLAVSRGNTNYVLDWYVTTSNGTSFTDRGLWLDNFAVSSDQILVGNFYHQARADITVAEPRSNNNTSYRWWMLTSAH
jgi:hypothetical protein